VIEPPCAVCGRRSSRIELVPPATLPVEWERWPEEHRAMYRLHHDPAKWRLLFEGVVAGNGLGGSLSEAEAQRTAAAFALPYDYARIGTSGLYDDAGFCEGCSAFYCEEHWHPSTTGYGACPRGHGKSLDPHWSPE
jgi:hypothetical protein